MFDIIQNIHIKNNTYSAKNWACPFSIAGKLPSHSHATSATSSKAVPRGSGPAWNTPFLGFPLPALCLDYGMHTTHPGAAGESSAEVLVLLKWESRQEQCLGSWIIFFFFLQIFLQISPPSISLWIKIWSVTYSDIFLNIQFKVCLWMN